MQSKFYIRQPVWIQLSGSLYDIITPLLEQHTFLEISKFTKSHQVYDIPGETWQVWIFLKNIYYVNEEWESGLVDWHTDY